MNHAIQDIYEISYDNCELSLDKGKTNQNGLWINGKEAVTANRSFVKIGDPLTAPEISSDDIQLNFKDGNSLGSVESGDISVSIPQAPDAIYISPR
ncbi:MAG: hypothetical protein OMM_08818 [Candidatus Magnetoglobus multicellularis str. Araruama]|uniref:Uncharacterized protein n=1 Tax=Candidatus Magnetoglobus multicellularis str. Araruama TaxID=890399 RepID=A0A1V1P6M1_9BACT|nr:MAG: hypothetical protein OMM_08818 [Candidatus Magnetoglobus multicellularis str. Araruama]